jgi:hypothetical protein
MAMTPVNRAKVIALLEHYPDGITRKQVAHAAGMNWSSVRHEVQALLMSGEVLQMGEVMAPYRGGRVEMLVALAKYVEPGAEWKLRQRADKPPEEGAPIAPSDLVSQAMATRSALERAWSMCGGVE